MQQDKSQEGTGSAENTGRERTSQQNPLTHLDQNQRQDIAQQAGLKENDIADLDDLGQTSGRDDYAGGDNDAMSGSSTGERTDR
ncbi:MAG: hypothetical protein JWP69_1566 [Flaviaesturariibacter sp.]|nr:hypothetical protein [Flaviaesturariibacter sp.]